MASNVLSRLLPKITENVIRQFGATIVITRVETGEYDTTTGIAPRVEHAYEVTGVVAQVGKRSLSPGKTRKEIMISATEIGFVPKVGDGVTIEGQDYKVIEVDDIPAGDAVAGYIMRVER